MMKKVYITYDDPWIYDFYTEKEVEEMFGEELEERFTYISDELYHRYLKAKEELFRASNELRLIEEERN